MSATKKKTPPVKTEPAPAPAPKPVITTTDIETMLSVINLASRGGVIQPGNDQIVVGQLNNRLTAVLNAMKPPVAPSEDSPVEDAVDDKADE